MRVKFGWCNDGHHDKCRRVLMGSGKHYGNEIHCACTKEGCACAEWNANNKEESDEDAA